MRLKDKLIKESFRQFRKSETALHPLKYLFWECTLRCNLSCIHCGSDCHTNETLPDMPAAVFLNVLKEIAKQYSPSEIIVVLTGGEPLLRTDLPEIGLQIRKLGFRWGLVTNGFALSKALMNKLVNSGLGAITLSLDGIGEDHNWIRNHPKAFDKSAEALETILAYPRVNADVVTCVNKRNLPHLDAIHDYLQYKGLKSWRLFTITPIGRAKNQDELLLSALEFKRLMDYIVSKKSATSSMEVNFSCESYLGTYEMKARDQFFFCRAGINIGSVLADGSISACPNIDRHLIQGSIYEDSFVTIWENKFTHFRNRSWTQTGICKNCKEYPYCAGSGLHWWQYENQNLLRCHYQDLQLVQKTNP